MNNCSNAQNDMPKPEANQKPQKAKRSKTRKRRKAALIENNLRLKDYPTELRGPPQNRFGGHKTRRIKPFTGSTFGPAGPCRKYSRAECAQVERELRDKGSI
jgi:hypothetical protein